MQALRAEHTVNLGNIRAFISRVGLILYLCFLSASQIHAQQTVNFQGTIVCGNPDSPPILITSTMTVDRNIVKIGDAVNGTAFTDYPVAQCGGSMGGPNNTSPIIDFSTFFPFPRGAGEELDFGTWTIADVLGTHTYGPDVFSGVEPCFGTGRNINCTFSWSPPTGGFPSPPVFALLPPYTALITFYAVGVNVTVVNDNTPDLGPCKQCEAQAGTPINLTNGNTWIDRQDYSLPGLAGGLTLLRTWNSLWTHNAPIVQAGMFGDSWQANYEKRLQVLNASSPGANTQVKYWRGDGSAWTFTWNQAANQYALTAPLDERAFLFFDSTAELFTMVLKDGSKQIFDNAGYLTSIVDRNGNTTVLHYDGGQRLTAVTDAAGRSLSFNYGNGNFPNLATSIQDAVRVVATYSYDAGGRLTTVAYADGSSLNYSYDANGLILSVTDANNKVLEAHSYDAFRRGLTSQRANGVDSVSVNYVNGTAILQDSTGNTTSYNRQTVGGRNYIAGISGSGCASCGGRGNWSFAYDNMGNQTRSTDPVGNVTSYIYDGNGNVTSRSTRLANGTVQTWSYTYNIFSEVTSATDPLGNTTFYQYDANGNLKKVINSRPAPPRGGN
jgi:YD repeat-containing protein